MSIGNQKNYFGNFSAVYVTHIEPLFAQLQSFCKKRGRYRRGKQKFCIFEKRYRQLMCDVISPLSRESLALYYVFLGDRALLSLQQQLCGGLHHRQRGLWRQVRYEKKGYKDGIKCRLRSLYLHFIFSVAGTENATDPWSQAPSTGSRWALTLYTCTVKKEREIWKRSGAKHRVPTPSAFLFV